MDKIISDAITGLITEAYDTGYYAGRVEAGQPEYKEFQAGSIKRRNMAKAYLVDTIAALTQERDALREVARWRKLEEEWPAEGDNVIICINGSTYPAWWETEADGDWETGYKKYAAWYYAPEGDKYEGLDPYGVSELLWMPFPKPPAPPQEADHA